MSQVIAHVGGAYLWEGGSAYLRQDFDQGPLLGIIEGGAWSKSLENHSARVGALAGFGMFYMTESFFYLDRDLALDMQGISPGVSYGYDQQLHAAQWPPHPDGPLVLLDHDRDIALQPDFLDRLFTALPAGAVTLSLNQYIGFLHTRIDSSAADGWQLTFNFKEPYCAYFVSHRSSWRLWLADSPLQRLKANHLNISVDGRTPATVKTADFIHETLPIELPPGVGHHIWKLAQNSKKDERPLEDHEERGPKRRSDRD